MAAASQGKIKVGLEQRRGRFFFGQVFSKIILPGFISDNMDSLTSRLMSRSGLNAANPTLPPVHNMRVVHLKEPFEEAEIHLHDARVALRDLGIAQDAQKPQSEIDTAAQALYTAMEKLQTSEADYFASRYFGRDKSVLKGWTHDHKQKQLKTRIAELFKAEVNRREKITGATNLLAEKACNELKKACDAVKALDESWYSSSVRLTKSNGFGTHQQDIEDALHSIYGHLQAARALVLKGTITPTMKKETISSIHESLRDTLECRRLAQIITTGRWELS